MYFLASLNILVESSKMLVPTNIFSLSCCRYGAAKLLNPKGMYNEVMQPSPTVCHIEFFLSWRRKKAEREGRFLLAKG
jgi:hypothetical protein